MSNKGLTKAQQFVEQPGADTEIEKVSVTDNTDDEKKKKGPIKGCIFEVCVDLQYFGDKLPDFDECAKRTGADEYMWLIHDSDTYDETDLKALKAKGLDMSKYQLDAPKNDHLHEFLHFSSSTTLPKIAKAFGVPEQNVQRWKGRTKGVNVWGNAISYLTHRTENAKHKYQYDPADVHANFDYVKSLETITKDVEQAKKRVSKHAAKSEFQRLVDLYTTGEMSFKEFKRQLAADPAVMQIGAKQRRFLDSLHSDRDAIETDLFFKMLTQPQRVIWLYGSTASGKTKAAKYMAKHFARKRFKDEPEIDNSYQVLGSSTGMFEQYSSSVHCIILDDFRPGKAGTFQASDLFRIFEPNQDQPAQLPARYHDRLLAAGMIIVTSNIDPAEFYYRAFKKWTAVRDELRLLFHEGSEYKHDSDEKDYQIDFDDVRAMMLDENSGHEMLRRFDADGKEVGSKEVVDRMRLYYLNHFRGVDCIEVNDNMGSASRYTEEDLKHMDAIKLAQVPSDVIESVHKVKGKTIWTADWKRRQSNNLVWNSLESPAPLMRRMSTYRVSIRVDNLVDFTLMRPVEHDDGYCDFEPEKDARLWSLEDVWNGKRIDFNSDFDLKKQDQTLSDAADFARHFRKTYLYIRGADRSRYLDAGDPPKIEPEEIYDYKAFNKALEQLKENKDQSDLEALQSVIAEAKQKLNML